jgi:hypothetical protein
MFVMMNKFSCGLVVLSDSLMHVMSLASGNERHSLDGEQKRGKSGCRYIHAFARIGSLKM